ncbi:hypothetical protein COB52_03360 [Candidatus Kaiserbacteria bacterium]|nr:MAG: hypothetical protein COB52_03360 [Candidatus Kaiserbacteria bacterium]
MEILVVIPWGIDSGAGVEKNSTLVLNALATDFSIKVVVVGMVDESVRENFNENIEVDYIKVSRVRESILPLRAIIKESNPDIIIGNIPSSCIATYIALVLSGGRAKFISVNHGFDTGSFFDRLSANLLGIFSDKVIAVSEGVKKSVLLGREKTTVIYNAFDIKGIQEQAEAEIEHFSKPYVVYVGRLHDKQKGLSTLMKATKLAGQDLVVVGDGEDRHVVEEANLVGWKRNPFPYIKGAEALVLSSNFEGFGRILVEALSLGVSVVSTDCKSGPSEILENGKYGILVPVGDAKMMADAIREVVKNPFNKEELIKRAEFFDVKRAVESYRKLLYEI